MQNAKLDEAQAGIKIAGRNINNTPPTGCLKGEAVSLTACIFYQKTLLRKQSDNLDLDPVPDLFITVLFFSR